MLLSGAILNCLARRGERPTRVRAWRVRDRNSKFSERSRMYGATDNRAAQSSLTLTLSPRGARE